MNRRQEPGFWHNSFLDEVESRTVADGVLIWAFSGAGFALRSAQAMIYLDPYFGLEGEDCPLDMHRTTAITMDPRRIRTADAALISHEHLDHCHPETIEAMAGGCGELLFFGPSSAAEKMQQLSIGQDRVRKVEPGETFAVNGATVSVLPAYDKDEPLAVSYLIESGGVRIFFAGDSAAGPAFDEVGADGNLDIAMLAFGRTWYMNESEMLDAAERLRPKLLLPYHWEIWRGHTGDPLKLGRLVERRRPNFDVKLLLVGDYLHYRNGGHFEKGP